MSETPAFVPDTKERVALDLLKMIISQVGGTWGKDQILSTYHECKTSVLKSTARP